ncbi:MAG TPA: hypothetical protein VK844_05915, partial [Hyphomicrobiales bacterium]|nr:hypothetical protein [Hyphomicrobiales bacterium]
GGSASIKQYAKFNAKADKWFVKGPDGDDAEIPRPTFVADLANIATGWLRFREGEAPERLIDPSLDRAAPSPGEGFKRGFVLSVFSPKFFGGLVELSSASIHMGNAIREVYQAFDEARGEHPGQVPVIACTGSEPMKDKYGTNYRPKLQLVRWVDRPSGLPDESPVDASDVWQGAAPTRTQATHVPPPAAAPTPTAAPAPAPTPVPTPAAAPQPADPMLQTEF